MFKKKVWYDKIINSKFLRNKVFIIKNFNLKYILNKNVVCTIKVTEMFELKIKYFEMLNKWYNINEAIVTYVYASYF